MYYQSTRPLLSELCTLKIATSRKLAIFVGSSNVVIVEKFEFVDPLTHSPSPNPSESFCLKKVLFCVCFLYTSLSVK